MKKFLGIVVLGLFFSANFLAIDLRAEVVKDPDLIKELNELVEEKKKKKKEDHKNNFFKVYFDQYIKCTKKKVSVSFFSNDLKIVYTSFSFVINDANKIIE